MASGKRTVLITGCSDGGLGHYLAVAFHEAGWRVFASARNLKKTREVAKVGIEIVQLDTLSKDSIAAAVAEITERAGSLDLLLNNAGAGYTMPVLDLEWERARDLFELNVWTLVTMSKAFLPLLRKSSNPIIVNNTSGAALWVGAMPFGGAYNASKGAASQLTETMRHELAPFGVKVINLLTGGVKTNFYDAATTQPLPEDSIFGVAKELVEEKMSGKEIMEQNSDPRDYARQVVSQLNKKNPPHWIWAGKNMTVARLATFLPIGTIDSVLRSLTGLDAVEKILKRSGSKKKA